MDLERNKVINILDIDTIDNYEMSFDIYEVDVEGCIYSTQYYSVMITPHPDVVVVLWI